MEHVLITGGAGFIGSHLSERLLLEGYKVTSIDNFDNFYDRSIKEENIRISKRNQNFQFFEIDICDFNTLITKLNEKYDAIIHLAAKAGVRPSILNPFDYERVNVLGTQNLLEFAKDKKIDQFVFGSSSSVYGVNSRVPWSEDDGLLMPISPYAATKISGELFGHVYSRLYNIRFIALRFFTVFGPRQRPDLAISKFFRLIRNGSPIPFYGDGSTQRDYTFVQDIVNGILSALRYKDSMYEIINLGNSCTITLAKLLKTIEAITGLQAEIEAMPEQEGDVRLTFADIDKAERLLNYKPAVNLEEGLKLYNDWLNQNNLLNKCVV